MIRIILSVGRRLTGLPAEARQMIMGAGLAFDPLPERRFVTFERNDGKALARDWESLSADMWGLDPQRGPDDPAGGLWAGPPDQGQQPGRSADRTALG